MSGLAVRLSVVLALASTAIARGADAPAPTLAKKGMEPVWGQITRADASRAEFDLGVRHGLWAGTELEVYHTAAGAAPRRLGVVKVEIAGDGHSVGKLQAAAVAAGDRVLFRKPKPSPDEDSDVNQLIGAKVDIVFQNKANDGQAYQAVVLDAVATEDDEIASVVVVFTSRTRSASNARHTYPASMIRSLTTEDETYVFDPDTRTLTDPFTLEILTKAKEAEQEQQRLAAERQKAEDARLADEALRRHMVFDPVKRNYLPAAGYQWAGANDFNTGVRWAPGTTYPGQPHVVAAAQEGYWTAEAGYTWKDAANPVNGGAKWAPGMAHPSAPHVVAGSSEGFWVPEAGYRITPKFSGDLTTAYVGDERPKTAPAAAPAGFDDAFGRPSPGMSKLKPEQVLAGLFLFGGALALASQSANHDAGSGGLSPGDPCPSCHGNPGGLCFTCGGTGRIDGCSECRGTGVGQQSFNRGETCGSCLGRGYR